MSEVELPFRLLTPDGRWAIEITEQADGQFCVLVILDGKDTIDSLFSDDSEKVIAWAFKQMQEAMRRTGEVKNEQPG